MYAKDDVFRWETLMVQASEEGRHWDHVIWSLDHPEESLVGLCRTLEKLRIACSFGIALGAITSLAALGASGATWLIPVGFTALLCYIRWDLPSVLRTLVSTINLLRTRDLPEDVKRGDVISVYAYRHRNMPDWGNVLLAEVQHVGHAEMMSFPFKHDIYAVPTLASLKDRERGRETQEQAVGIVEVLSEPIWEAEELVRGEVRQGDLAHFFIEGGLALIAGKVEAPNDDTI